MSRPKFTKAPIDKDESKILKEVEKNLRGAHKAARVLEDFHARMKRPEKRLASFLGVIPVDIYETNPTKQNDLCSRLPPEIQRMVWSYLTGPSDRIALALTCKRHAQMRIVMDQFGQEISPVTVQKEHTLALLIQLSSWMPKNYRLCFSCIEYRPYTNHEEWGGDSHFHSMDQIKAGGRVSKMAMIKGPRCAACKYRERITQFKNRSVVKEYQNLLRKFVGPLR